MESSLIFSSFSLPLVVVSVDIAFDLFCRPRAPTCLCALFPAPRRGLSALRTFAPPITHTAADAPRPAPCVRTPAGRSSCARPGYVGSGWVSSPAEVVLIAWGCGFGLWAWVCGKCVRVGLGEGDVCRRGDVGNSDTILYIIDI
jgi:hypothetical protein